MTSSRRWRAAAGTATRVGILGLLLGALSVLGLAGGSTPAVAADQPPVETASPSSLGDQEPSATASVDELRSRLQRVIQTADAMAVQVSQAVEAYDAAEARRVEAQASAATTTAARMTAAARVDRARSEVGRLASASYRSGGPLADLSLVLSFRGTRDLAGRVAAVRFVGASMARTYADLRAAEDAAVELERLAVEEARAGQEAAAAAEQARRALEVQLADRERRVAVLRAEQDTLVRALTDLDELSRAGRQRLADTWSAAEVPPPTAVDVPGDPARRAVVTYALDQLGKPYLWASSGPDSFDCSGLTLRAWEQGGVALSHYSQAQFRQSRAIDVPDARPGDLVFYAADPADPLTIYHVGLYVGGGQMVEAPHPGATVRLASILRSGLLGIGRPAAAD